MPGYLKGEGEGGGPPLWEGELASLEGEGRPLIFPPFAEQVIYFHLCFWDPGICKNMLLFNMLCSS